MKEYKRKITIQHRNLERNEARIKTEKKKTSKSRITEGQKPEVMRKQRKGKRRKGKNRMQTKKEKSYKMRRVKGFSRGEIFFFTYIVYSSVYICIIYEKERIEGKMKLSMRWRRKCLARKWLNLHESQPVVTFQCLPSCLPLA